MQVEWLTKEEAAKRLGLGLRRTLDLAHQGVLETVRVRDEESHQVAVRYHAGDIERYLSERRKQADAGAQRQLARKVNDAAVTKPASVAIEPSSAVALLSTIAAGAWLSLAEGAQYIRLPAELLLKLIFTGRLPALRVRGTRETRPIDCYRVKRADLDALTGERYGLPEGARAAGA